MVKEGGRWNLPLLFIPAPFSVPSADSLASMWDPVYAVMTLLSVQSLMLFFCFCMITVIYYVIGYFIVILYFCSVMYYMWVELIISCRKTNSISVTRLRERYQEPVQVYVSYVVEQITVGVSQKNSYHMSVTSQYLGIFGIFRKMFVEWSQSEMLRSLSQDVCLQINCFVTVKCTKIRFRKWDYWSDFPDWSSQMYFPQTEEFTQNPLYSACRLQKNVHEFKIEKGILLL